ncbi:uncharacterized protein LOC113499910 [Trichoplusia ni]|uniref:Uncharacterized protein LOC113499910 n=1 Tax=Trichoplusia ni TaxID=7111 RepID=A0A7E5W7W3_TRINI|nr:uncharacterized protein LOC113499910 [Trichoplusia ni]
MKTGILYGIVASSKTRVRCVFCGVHIPKATRCIEQHSHGAKHKENIDLMNENGIWFENETLLCKPCNRIIPNEESVIRHIDGDDHANWMAAVEDLVDGEFITLEAFLSCEKDEVFCEVCHCEVLCTLQSIEEHVNHLSHRSKITDRLRPLNGIFPVENEDEVWCKVCDIYIDSSVPSILSHIDDDEQHMEWFAEIEDLIESQEVSIEAYLANEHEKFAYCSKCHTEIPCNAQSLESHVHSVVHLDRFGL